MNNKIYDALIGVAVGDALGVPVEFKSREELRRNPITDMIGYGTYNQPAGTWSDDSSLTFCLAESLSNGFNLEEIAKNFINWKENAHWTAHNEVFDIGITTSQTIKTLKKLIQQGRGGNLNKLGNLTDERSNGNGSLMRILPLLFYIKGKSSEEQFRIIWEVSALTHYHIRAAIACFIYLKLAEKILEGKNKKAAYQQSVSIAKELFINGLFPKSEEHIFQRIINGNIQELEESQIESGGYVMHSLEASIWCLLTENDYKSAVLKAVNLGHDTDTTAAITGGLAGLYYGSATIPKNWIEKTARLNDIKDLADQLQKTL